MLFQRIEVRESLLKVAMNRTHTVLERVEIDLESNCRSPRALELIKSGQQAESEGNTQLARGHYCDASLAAKADQDSFIEAAAIMLQALVLDGWVPMSTQPDHLSNALSLLQTEILAQQERLLEQRTPRKDALPIMAPRLDLLELLQENLAQFEFRQKSLPLADARNNVDRLLQSNHLVAAENSARFAARNATTIFGADHWWHAVMTARLSRALLRQGKPDEARTLMWEAAHIIQEWTVEHSEHYALKTELGQLRVLHKDMALSA